MQDRSTVHPGGQSAAPAPSRAEKDRLLQRNHELLLEDLRQHRLLFASRPRLVDLQLSNICNMSCTMCYDGSTVEPRRLDLDVLRRFAAEVLPTTAAIVPFAGSEPLIVTWDVTLELARTYDVELDLITNAQFLDEQKFTELEPHVSSLTFSIDSHMREVYERIRLRSVPEKVFENFPRAARMCRENGIEPCANVVFMVENAAYMEETVAYLADQGCSTIRLLAYHHPVNARAERRFSDAVLHMSKDWLAWKLGQIEKVARQKQVCVVFEGLDRHNFDYRPATRSFRPSRSTMHGIWDALPLYYPGYCAMSTARIKVTTDGDVYPCCVAQDDDLHLGNLHHAEFGDIWNGPNARELRRAMLTQDLPDLCRSCSHHLGWIPQEKEHLPAIDWYHDSHVGGTVARIPQERRTLALESPEHLQRQEAPPTFRWAGPNDEEVEFHLVVAVAGAWDATNKVYDLPSGTTSFTMPEADWLETPPNMALWWCVYALRRGDLSQSLRSERLRCVVRHSPIPEQPGNTLKARTKLLPTDA